MSVHVRISVQKDASDQMQAEALASASRVKRALKAVGAEASAAGLEMIVHMRPRASIAKEAAVAAPDDGWPTGDLTRRSWRP